MTLHESSLGDAPSAGLDPALSSRLLPISSTTRCTKCQLPLEGEFVRALDGMFHQHCFTCIDCNEPVANRFIPMTAPDGTQHPYCERDYFKRLNLACDTCGEALRGSYITACNKSYHLHHFCCSVCSVVFGPDDSYYEHDNNVYCHYHYSLHFAIKCSGCQIPILKQFVEISKNDQSEHWHPECHMINKFWNVKLAQALACRDQDLSTMTPDQYAEMQVSVEDKIYRIWTVLSAFEESAAACISDMLIQVSIGGYLESAKMADYFITHVEVLFAALDDLMSQHQTTSKADLQHLQEAKQLCTTVINFFSLLSHTQENGLRRMGVTENLLSLVGGLAHNLKMLIRIGLKAALNLETKPSEKPNAVSQFLSQLIELANKQRYLPTDADSSLASDLCQQCKQTCDDACFRLGHDRWHDGCFSCHSCSRSLCDEYKDAFYDANQNGLLCKHCAIAVPDAKHGFVRVTQLQQFSFQLRFSLRRLYTLLSDNFAVAHPVSNSTTTALPTTPHADASDAQNDHIRTAGAGSGPAMLSLESRSKSFSDGDRPQETINLGDIKRMKSTRIKRPLADSHRVAKRSTLMETPSPNAAFVGTEQDAIQQQLVDQAATMSSVDKEAQDEQLENPTEALMLGDYTLLKRKKQDWAEMEASEGGATGRYGTKPHYLSELSALDTFMVKHFAVLSLEKIVKDYFTLEELADLIDDKPPKIWTKFVNNLIAGGNKKPAKEGTFGVALATLVEKNGTASSLGLSPSGVRIPAFIDDCISTMKQMDMSVEGIFRKNGNIKRLKELAEEIDKNPNAVNLANESPIQVAALTKKFLRDLPDPLLTFKLYKLFTVIQKLGSHASQKRALHLAFCLLPKPNRDTAEVLFLFMHWVAGFAHLDNMGGSKMDLTNLATVIAPNILYSKSKDPAKQESLASIEVVQLLMEYHKEFCAVPEDLWQLLNRSSYDSVDMDANVHEILRKCEILMKLKVSDNNGMPPIPARQHSSPAAVPTLATTANEAKGLPSEHVSQPTDRIAGLQVAQPHDAVSSPLPSLPTH